MEIIREILHPNLETSSNQPNSANQLATHRGDLMAEDMFDARANTRAASVVRLLLCRQGFIAIPLAMNLRAQVPSRELRFNFLGAIGRVGPNLSSSLGRQQHVREDHDCHGLRHP